MAGFGRTAPTAPWVWARTPLLVALPPLLAILLTACGGAEQSSPEERARRIDRQIICPVCPSQTIDQSQVPLAAQMRGMVRERLAAGWTEAQVLAYFAAPERFGERVLAAPPRRGFNLLAWVVPPVGGVAALLLLALAFRSIRRGATTATFAPETPAAEAPTEALQPYLDRVDAELRGRTFANGSTPAPRSKSARDRDAAEGS